MRKVLFFDIDGTLVSEVTERIPESACNALIKAKDNGHLLFVNTGRTMCRIVPELKRLPFDGFLCGCGIYLTYNDKVFFEKKLSQIIRNEVMNEVIACNIDGVFESSEKVYYFSGKSRFDEIERLKERLIEEGNGAVCYPEKGDCYFDKLYITTDEKSDTKRFLKSISAKMDIIDRERGAFECIPKGFSKATAMDMVYQKFGITKEDSYVFGDSSNDITMFKNAGHTIAMGVHSVILEPFTEYVTKTVEEDGIAYAMEHYGII